MPDHRRGWAGRTDGVPVPTIKPRLCGRQHRLWFGFFVPAKTPGEVVAKLSAAIGTALAAPEVVERLVSEHQAREAKAWRKRTPSI